MLSEPAMIGMWIKALGYGIPAAIMTFAFFVFMILVKYQKAKTERDRTEHMKKWDSMIATQTMAIESQKESMGSLIESHKEEIERIMGNHKREMDRMFNLNERQARTMEVFGHNLTVISQHIENKQICPHDRRQG